jgi:signal transduction histidine kinase
MSIRFKLIVVATIITVFAFAAVVISNLELIRHDKRQSLEISNQQVSELVSRSVINQISEHQRSLRYLFEAWKTNPNLQVDSDFFPDYLWVQFIDWEGQPLFEWTHEEKLAGFRVPPDRLLGKQNRSALFAEMKSVLHQANHWVLFNSTIDPFMPSFLLGAAFSSTGSDRPDFVVLAEVFAEPLFNRVEGRSGQELMLIDSHQNILLSTRPGWDPSRIALSDEKILEKIRSLEMGKSDLSSVSYPNRETQLTWFYKFQEGSGLTLVLQEPESSLTAGQDRILKLSGLVGAIVLVLALNLIILLAGRITRPLRNLNDLMDKVGKGEFSGRIEVKSKDEIGQLAKGFNRMLEDLAGRDEEINRAKQKLIQSEKMSAFGQMSAGIAHEVKNPLAGILGYSQILKKKLEDRPDLVAHAEIIEKETNRCKEIVENLMKFARQEKSALSKIDLNKTIQDSVRLVEHQITVSGIRINQNFWGEGTPILIEGSANQLQQVMLNLMLNAQHAMENRGSLSVSTHYDAKKKVATILISDTGCGMSEEVKQRIFEPFFTTKGVGKGTGLGLSVTLGILKDHKANIDVESQIGKGTTFKISFPVLEVGKANNKSEQVA